jgi:hypothetical protein
VSGEVLARWIHIRQRVVDVAMLKGRIEIILELLQVSILADETDFIQGFGLKQHLNDEVVSVNAGALMTVGQVIQPMGRMKLEPFTDGIHTQTP